MSKKQRIILILFITAFTVAGLVWLPKEASSKQPTAGSDQSDQTSQANAKVSDRDENPDPDVLPDQEDDRIKPVYGDRSKVDSYPGKLGHILADESELNARERVDLLRDRSDDFSEIELQTLADYLREGKIPEGLTQAEWHWIVDQMFTSMREVTEDPVMLTGLMRDVFHGAKDVVVRDYAMQHLGHLGREGGDAEIARETAMTALKEVDTSVGGTALLALHNDSEFQAQRVMDLGAYAVQMLSQDGASTQAKVAAFQVATQHGATGLHEAALAVLVEEKANPLLKLAALNTITVVGHQADVPFLESLPYGNAQVHQAVRAAIQKLSTQS